MTLVFYLDYSATFCYFPVKMIHLTDGLNFSVFRALLPHHSIIVLLLLQSSAGQHQVVGPSQPTVAIVGDDIILPCHVEPAVSVSEMTVEWARPDLDPRFVYVWRDGVELESKKHPSYSGRTSLFINNLKMGDISLKLSKVKRSDTGKFKCFIPELGASFVDLVVGAVSSPFIVSINRTSSQLVLQCESKGWYPEPEVFWLDGEGNLLSAGPTETVRGPDDLYTVSRRLTVEKRDNFTCRVQQKNINQTRETHFYIPEDVFAAPSSSAVCISVVLPVVGFLLFFATFFVYRKLKKNKSYNMDHDCGTGEREELVKETTKMELQEVEKEQKDIIHGISVMIEKMKELEMSREKQKSQQDEVEREKMDIERSLESKGGLLSWISDGKKKKELENEKTDCERSLQSIKDRLQETDNVIGRITEWKKKVEEQIEEINKQIEETKGRRDEIQVEKEETNKNTEASPLTHCPETQPNES